jgi:AAHS family 4-hydroxybenzoate transporter-like MFS transporter
MDRTVSTDGQLDEPVAVGKIIDGSPIGWFQLRVLVLCTLLLFFDGFDTQIMAFIAPAVAAEFSLTRADLGPLFAASILGILFGALLFGPVADRVGRRMVILMCAAGFSLLTLASAASSSFEMLLALRFLTGLGLGGAMPNASSLTAEYSPLRRRATMVMAAFLGFGLGAAAGGIVSAALLPGYGWRSVLVVGGAFPLVVVVVSFFMLPESLRFLVLRKAPADVIARLIRKIQADFRVTPQTFYVIDMEGTAGMPVVELFRARPPSATLLLWFVFFAILLANFTIQNWIPTLAHDLGLSLEIAVLIGTVYQVGGVVASLLLGVAIDRFGPFKIIPAMLLIAVPAIALIGQAGAAVAALMCLTFVAGFCISGGLNCSNALAALFYPTSVRSTGSGWALGIGRIGAIIGPILAGWLLANNYSMNFLFILIAGVPACAAIGCILMGSISRRAGVDMQVRR